MWGLFAFACLVFAFFLYAPGYLVLRAFRCMRIVAACCAPIVSIAGVVLLSFCLTRASVLCSWLTVGLPLVAAGACIYGGSALLARNGSGKSPDTGILHPRFDAMRWKHLALYIGVSAVVATYAYLFFIADPNSPFIRTDNTAHLNAIRAFFDSGRWTPASLTAYATPEDAAIKPLISTGSSFYPAAWHCLCALCMSATGVSAPMAENASCFVLVAVAFPSALYMLLSKLFEGDVQAVLCGSIVALGFAAFPWGIMTFGPLLPNLCSYAVFPSIACICMELADRATRRESWVPEAALFLIGFVDLAFIQPNTLFFGVVMLTPYISWRLWTMPVKSRARARVFAAAFVLFVALVWVLLYKAPPLQGVVHYNAWKPYTGKLGAIAAIALNTYQNHPPQILLSVLVAIGCIRCVLKREHLWLLAVLAFCCLQYFATACGSGTFRHLLAGFWYTDGYRLAANLAIVSIPFACIGLSATAGFLMGLVPAKGGGRASRKAVALAVIAVFAVVNFFPNFSLPGFGKVRTAFGGECEVFTTRSNPAKNKIYTAAERAFAQRVKDTIAADALVINKPYDGSIYSYGACGLRTYYRKLFRDDPKETQESLLVRNSLGSIANNAEVRDAVKAIGAEYVMILDRSTDPQITPQPRKYKAEMWTGIDAVADSTPGFEVVLAQGDMRLYRITATG